LDLKKISITIHGLIGYSALLAMLVDTVLIWKYWLNNKNRTVVSKHKTSFVYKICLLLVDYSLYCRHYYFFYNRKLIIVKQNKYEFVTEIYIPFTFESLPLKDLG